MDDSVLAVLPPDVSSEAMGLRRELEQRRAQYMQERAFDQSEAVSMFSQLLRHSGERAMERARHRTADGAVQFTHVRRILPGACSGWGIRQSNNEAASKKTLSRQLVDHDGVACLLVLLFLDEPKLNIGRLHRVLKNISFHKGTRLWIIKALISVIIRTSGMVQDGLSRLMKSPNSSTQKTPSKKTQSSHASDESLSSRKSAQWLSRSLDSSFGNRVDLFEIRIPPGKVSDKGSYVSVHPHAASFVNKHIVEALLFLAKNFPSSFTPFASKKDEDEQKKGESSKSNEKKDNEEAMDDKVRNTDISLDFWNILYRLNSVGPGRKGKLPLKSSKDIFKDEVVESFDNSPLGQLLAMLSHPVIKRNTALIDKLLRLLAIISMSLPEPSKQEDAPATSSAIVEEPEVEASLPVATTQPTVTFAAEDTIVERSPLVVDESVLPENSDVTPGTVAAVSEETDHDLIFPGASHFSETSSVTSSLFVESSPAPIDTVDNIPAGVRSPRAESVLSYLSDGTLAGHSDISGPAAGAHEEPMEIDRASHVVSDTSSNGKCFCHTSDFVKHHRPWNLLPLSQKCCITETGKHYSGTVIDRRKVMNNLRDRGRIQIYSN